MVSQTIGILHFPIHLKEFILSQTIFEKTFPSFSSFQNRQTNLNQFSRSCSSIFFRGFVWHASIFCFARNIKMPKLWKCSYWNTSFLYTCMSKCVTGMDFAGCFNPLFSKTTWFIFSSGSHSADLWLMSFSYMYVFQNYQIDFASWVPSTAVCLGETHPLKISGFCSFGIVRLVKCWEVLILLTALEIQSHALNTTCFAAFKKAPVNNFFLLGIFKKTFLLSESWQAKNAQNVNNNNR